MGAHPVGWKLVIERCNMCYIYIPDCGVWARAHQGGTPARRTLTWDSGGICSSSPRYCVQLQGVSAAELHVTRGPNYGMLMGKLTVSGAASVCTLQWNPHLMFRFSDPQVSALSAKFLPFKIFVTLLSKCAFPRGNLKYGFHNHQIRIYFNFIML
jgi:hypothetical protein